MYSSAHHQFHIPVMGIAFTIDTPVKVARFGISSVISIVEDRLIEMMRKHYYPTIHQQYQPITIDEDDYRAKRITDYLNLVNTIVKQQVERLKMAAFETGSEIVKYFEMLPDTSALKKMYRQMMNCSNYHEKEKLEIYLRTQIRAGSIDVNILTKPDRNYYNKKGEIIEDGSDAVAALRGYVKSELNNSSVIFSAGMNPRLYNYLGTCKEFDVNEDGGFTKKVTVKVSDYRSALIQGKYLAKKGIWVSEFRVESGLNCGGHAFATDGFLMGPILEEFKNNKAELVDALFEIYNPAQQKRSNRKFNYPPQIIISAQGGIGTHEEDDLLHHHYNIKSTGWGTPFLLVPEATTVDDATLKLLSDAKEKDVVLSRNSPLGVRFHYLKNTSAETEKLLRISKGKPGSPCTEKHLASNTEFTVEPICTASHKYQKLKIVQLQSLNLPAAAYEKQLSNVLAKECLCIGLSNPAAINSKESFVKNLNAVSVCPGPNIVNFSSIVSLQTMTNHIYGRENILTNNNRPHMFIAELQLYLNYFKEQLEENIAADQLAKTKKYLAAFFNNLKDGINYYHRIKGLIENYSNQFFTALRVAENELDYLNLQYSISEDQYLIKESHLYI